MDEMKVFGCTKETIKREYMNSLTAKLSGLEMVVMGILSDAQELLECGMNDASRKQMNVAKYILSEMMVAKRAAEETV